MNHPEYPRRKFLPIIIGVKLLCIGASTAVAQEAPMRSVVVKGERLLEQTSTYTANTMTAEEIREEAVDNPQQLFRKVPGVVVRSLSLGAVAESITMRGFGSGSHGGDIGFVLDGIPLNEAFSHSDGYTDFNAIIPLEISRLDVLKGPATALYGNYNRAGTMFFQTRKGGNYTALDTSVGSNKTVDVQAAMGREFGAGTEHKSTLNLAAQHYRTDGFRTRSSDFDKSTISLRYAYHLSDSADIALSGRWHQSGGNSGAYITAAQYMADPRGVDPRVIGDGAEKDYNNQRVDFNYLLAPNLKLLTFVYGTEQQFERLYTRPVSAAGRWAQRDEVYDRSVLGYGFSLNGAHAFNGGASVNWVAGMERFREDTQYQFYDDVQNRTRINPAVANRTFAYHVTSSFLETDLSISRQLRASLGVRHDRFSGSCQVDGSESLVGADGSVQGACNRPLNAVSRTSPKVGVRSAILPGMDLRASYSTGFQLANLRGLFAASGAATKPNVFSQREIGMSATPLRGAKLDLSYFVIDSDNEIREIPANSNTFVNFGETERRGIELTLNYRLADDWDSGLSYSRVKTEVKKNPTASLIGKEITGLPGTSAHWHIGYTPENGFGARADVRKVGQFAINPANTVYLDGYTTLDLNASYRGTWQDRRYRAYLGINNATDKLYATTSSLPFANIQIFGPAAGRTYQLGLQVDL